MKLARFARIKTSAVVKLALIAAISLSAIQSLSAQSILVPWSGFAHTPQHDCISPVPSQPLNRIKWTMPVVHGTPGQFTHFSGPLITRSNTVIVAVNLTNFGANFMIEALTGGTGQTNWEQPSDFTIFNNAPLVMPLAITPGNRLFIAGNGGTVLYCDMPDATNALSFKRLAFYGLTNYLMNSNAFNSSVYICTPITVDRYGDIFFGFETTGPAPLGLQSGLARIDYNGNGVWVNAAAVNGASNLQYRPFLNSAPALSLDQKVVYSAFSVSPSYPAYINAFDSRTLAPIGSAQLVDPVTGLNPGDYGGTASPTIGPDGDVYFGILGLSDDEGWLLHFDSTLSVAKIPGGFGWDTTDSVVEASLVPSYMGNSKYLLATKYNDYDEQHYSMALLDPQQGIVNSSTRTTVMATVLTIQSPVGLEWCINSSAVDPFSKSVLVNNEDGNLYRWDLTSNLLTESIALTTTQSGEAYTPTVVGVDGTVYAINHGYLFAIGQ